MEIVTATSTSAELGPLARIVERYAQIIEEQATAAGKDDIDWSPLSDLIAIDQFKRVGAYMEVMNWEEYARFITEWAGSTRFETTLFRVTEIGRSVTHEIEERHYKGDDFIRKNVVAVFKFNDEDKIVHLDIYEQAQDTGKWISDAAHTASHSVAE